MADSKEITKIMESMGWTDGSFIPIANEENKELMLVMGNLQVDKEKLTVDHQGLAHRNTKLSDHLVHAKNEIAQNLVKLNYLKGSKITKILKCVYRNCWKPIDRSSATSIICTRYQSTKIAL